MTEGRGELDPLLHRVALAAIDSGLRVAGIVQVNHDRPDCTRCDMDAIVLPDGPTIRISQSLGRESRGCRLNAEGLETAVAAAEARLREGADLLVVNKFGKQEAGGRGFRNVIADALAQGTDVLVGVNALNLPALRDFLGEDATQVRADLPDLLAWVGARVPH